MVNQRGQDSSLGHLLAESGALPLETALAIHRRVLDEVRELHSQGRTHRMIEPDTVELDETFRARLQAPPAERSFGGAWVGADYCPPELCKAREVALPAEITAAREALAAGGLALDPRRIDVYQLGALLCRLVSGRPVAEYLRNPAAKALVPAFLTPTLDRALGFCPTERVSDCGQLATELDSAPYSAGPAVPQDGGPPAPSVETPPGAHHKPPAHIPTEAISPEPVPFTRLGHYRILGRLGRGGMGEVYLAHDDSLDRRVAVKVISAGLAQHAQSIDSFRLEARAAAQLVHPNVVQVFFFGEDAGRHYFAMQFVDGESLASRLARRGRLSLAESLDLARDCLHGLAAAHQLGLIHRDVKPGNILLDGASGRALVADFGLVQAVGSRDATGAVRVIVGTADYMAPEQARGHTTDARADLYSLGVVLYRSLSGRLPFEADSAAAMAMLHAYQSPPKLLEQAPQTPAALAEVVDRLLAKEPQDRYPSAEAALRDVARLQAEALAAPAAPERKPPRDAAPTTDFRETPPLTDVPTRRQLARLPIRVRRLKWALGGVAAVLGLVLLAYAVPPILRWIRTPSPPPPREEVISDTALSDRDTALWFLGIEGRVRIKFQRDASGPYATLQAGDELPEEPFTLDAVLLDRNRNLADEDLGRLARHPMLTWLALDETAVTNKGLARLGRLPRLEQLGLFRTRVSDAGLKSIGKLSGLKHLDLTSTEVSDAGLAQLENLTNLENLQLGFTRVSDKGLKHLRGMRQLRVLNLDCEAVGDRGLEHLAGLRQLEELSLRGTRVGDEGLDQLQGLARLKSLNLGQSAVTDQGLPKLAALLALEELFLGLTAVSDEGLSALATLPALAALDLSGTKVSDAGLAHLGKIKGLRRLILSQTAVTDDGLKHLAAIEGLSELWLFDTKISDKGLENLVPLRGLTMLVLLNTQVTDAGLTQLSAALPQCQIQPQPPASAP